MFSMLVLIAILLFPDSFDAMRVVLIYWIVASIMLYSLTHLFQKHLREHEKTTRELKQQKLYLENLIEGAPEAIVWSDDQQRIKYINQKFVDMFGYSRQEVIGQDLDKLLADDENYEEAQAASKAVRNGKVLQLEGIRKRKDGTSIHVSIVGAPLTSVSGKREAFGLYRDTTDEWEQSQRLVNSEKSLRDLSAQLSDANNFKELLLDIITHDLRNPASVISGAIELLEPGSAEDEILQLIQNSARSLHEIIENASTLSKLSMGEAISLEHFDLIPLLKDVAGTFDSQLETAGMTLELDLPDTLEVNANRIIGEVIGNFLSNGIKYASLGGRLILSARQIGEFPEMKLSDFGETIPEDKREAIFMRSVQLLNGPRRGSGLGLAIVKRIATAHGATTGVRPNFPRGNVFYFSFEPELVD